jgi:hypothetical protein
MRSPMLVLAALALGSAIACEQKKSKVEQMAEEMASASASQAASVADAAPDPKELEYRQKKAAFETAVSNYVADLAHVMASDSLATPGILRQYFVSGAEGDKKAKEVESFTKDLGQKGYRIEGAVKIIDTRMLGTLDTGEIVFEEMRGAKGNHTCLVHEQAWKTEGEKWVFVKENNVRIETCPS